MKIPPSQIIEPNQVADPTEDVSSRRGYEEEEIRFRYRGLETINDISQIILQSSDIQITLDKILEKVISSNRFDLAGIRLVDSNTRMIIPVSSYGYRDPENVMAHSRRTAEALQNEILGRVLQETRAIMFEHLPPPPALRIMRREGIQSVIYIPIQAGGETLGILHLGSRTAEKFSRELTSHLETIGTQIGIAVQKSRLQEESRLSLKRLTALRDIDHAITSTLTLDRVLRILLEKIDLFFSYPVATAIRLWNQETGEMENIACRNIDEKEWKTDSKQRRGGIHKLIMQSRLPYKSLNLAADPNVPFPDFLRKYGFVSYLGIPLIARGQVVGILSFFTREEHDFTSQEIEMLTTLGDQAAVAIQNSQLYERTKKQAEALERARDELEHRVTERTQQLREANLKLQEVDHLKSVFLATMSHELRTPLNSIIGFTGILLKGLTGPLNQEQTKQLGMVSDSARHLLELINDVLEISKIEAGQLEITSEPFDLRESIGKVVATVTPLAQKKNLPVRTRWASQVGQIVSDRRRVEQVLINLISNAIKFTEQGEVRIEVELDKSSLAFRVIDTGIGIKPEDQEKLFRPFQQIDVGLTRSHEGTGLGLAICKRLVEMLGGAISVESQWGVGSAFTFTLPVSKGER